jgi:hypothetical protein
VWSCKPAANLKQGGRKPRQVPVNWLPGKVEASTDESSTIRILKLGEGIPDGAAEIHQRWKNDALALCIGGHVFGRIGRSRIRAEEHKQVGGTDAGGDPFDHDRSEAAITSQQKNCRNGNPVSFFGVE